MINALVAKPGGESESNTKEKIVTVDSIKGSSDWKEIFENKERYPEKMISSLEKNPELINFVKNYKNEFANATGGISSEESKEKDPLFLQWDERWGYVSYGDDMIGLSGCAPTCLSMVVYSLTRNKDATPDEFAQYSTQREYYVEGTGTSWRLLTDIPAKYHIKSGTLGLDEVAMKNHLDKGHRIICSVGPGDFTSAGHFIVIFGYNEDGFFVNDPNSRIRSAIVWDYETIAPQIKNLWVYENEKAK